jgi:hypothetical protein
MQHCQNGDIETQTQAEWLCKKSRIIPIIPPRPTTSPPSVPFATADFVVVARQTRSKNMSHGRVRRGSERQHDNQNRFILTMAVMSLATIFFGMQLMMVGPLQRSLESIQSRLDLTDLDLRKLVSTRNHVWQTNDLLTSLQDQHEGLAAARETLLEIQNFQSEVIAKSHATADALAALQNIAGVQQQLIAQADSETLVSARKTLDQIQQFQSEVIAKSHGTTDALAALENIVSVQQQLIAQADSDGLASARETLEQIQQFQSDVIAGSHGTTDALAALEDIASVQQKLIAQSDSTPTALAELDQLLGIKSSLVADANQTPTALEALAALDSVSQSAIAAGKNAAIARENVDALANIKNSVVNGLDNMNEAETGLLKLVALKDGINDGTVDVDAASETGEKLVTLNNRLVTDTNVDAASKNANTLIALGNSLSHGELDLQLAHTNLASLVSIQNSLTARSNDIASAVESLEIMADFRTDIDQHIRSLDGIRRTMMEIVMLESTVGRAARILRPLVELGSLRRLSDGEVRQAAKSILADRTTRLSQKQTDLQGARKIGTAADEFEPAEKLVPQPRDLEGKEGI